MQRPEQTRRIERRCSELLPVPHQHVVFTLPEELKPLLLGNPKAASAALFKAASRTLVEVAATSRHLGARIGGLAMLHTWTQKLEFHPQLHCVATGGGLRPDREAWVPTRPGFFLPVRVLSSVFRGKLISELERLVKRGELRDEDGAARGRLIAAARKPWVVYSKPPFGEPEHVVRYLGRYRHRTAIAIQRLVALENGRVTFGWRDRRNGDREKRIALDATEFLRRFLLHVLPKGFVRIGGYGLFANATKRRDLARCRKLLGAPAPERPAQESWVELLERLTGEDPLRCPACRRGRLVEVAWLPRCPNRRVAPGTRPP